MKMSFGLLLLSLFLSCQASAQITFHIHHKHTGDYSKVPFEIAAELTIVKGPHGFRVKRLHMGNKTSNYTESVPIFANDPTGNYQIDARCVGAKSGNWNTQDGKFIYSPWHITNVTIDRDGSHVYVEVTCPHEQIENANKTNLLPLLINYHVQDPSEVVA